MPEFKPLLEEENVISLRTAFVLDDGNLVNFRLMRAAETSVPSTKRRGPSLGSLVVLVRPGNDFTEVEKLVYEELERIKNEPVADWEIEKVRMQIRRQRAQALQSTLFRAILLGQYTVFYNDPSLINNFQEKVAAVTKEDVQRVARTYIKDTSRTVITTVPKPNATPPAQPAK